MRVLETLPSDCWWQQEERGDTNSTRTGVYDASAWRDANSRQETFVFWVMSEVV